MSTEIIFYQGYLFGIRVYNCGEMQNYFGVSERCMIVPHENLAPPLQSINNHINRHRTIAAVFVIFIDRSITTNKGLLDLINQLFRRFIKVNHWGKQMIRTFVNIKHLFQCTDKS